MGRNFYFPLFLACLSISHWSHFAFARNSTGSQVSTRSRRGMGFKGQVLHRSKRGWVWNQFFVIEEYTGPDPVLVGRLHTDLDSGGGKIRYILSGEGAGTIFVIDEKTGNIHATKTLDREERAQYTLMAQAVDRITNEPLEPPSEFIVKVQDINDNPPEFLNGPHHATVPEMSNVGTSVIQVTATDADDPSYGNSARLVYSILEGQPYFSVEPQTGIIRTALPNMDREAREEYLVVIQAKDMGGHMGGLSGTTKVTITLTDVNDNPPKFPQSVYQMSVSEDAKVGTLVGRLKAKDPDVGENGMVSYSIIDGDGRDFFEITTNSQTQEGIIKLKKGLDFEAKKSYSLKVEATNVYFDTRFVSRGPFKDTTTVKISVEDADEPPIFSQPVYFMEVNESAPAGTSVGQVHAMDHDLGHSPIRYSIEQLLYMDRSFTINPQSGVIKTTEPLDRELTAWQNISVIATEVTNRFLNLLCYTNQGLLHTTKGLSTLYNRVHTSRAQVAIKVLDINDNAPEFAEPYEVDMCENANSGKLIQTIKGVDKDESANGPRLTFTMAPNQNFTLSQSSGHTADIKVRRGAMGRRKQEIYLLPVVISDGGVPLLSSTNTFTVRVCSCSADGSVQSCNTEPLTLPAGLSTGALIAILTCIIILLVIVVLFVTLRHQKKEPLIVFEEEDVRENIISYDDEGGGEEDTEAFDIATLQNPDGLNGFLPRKDIKPELQFVPRQGFCPAPNSVDVDDFIKVRLQEADCDPTAPPYDSIQIYGYEGRGSVAGSLSSLESSSTESDLNYDYLNSWGPRFKRLADLYGSKDVCDDS
ncbi:cadherin-11-like isoform X2 [Narcine bancroftii]|uniref:cadherin-11-like isoform X2 n=1 Tax=Narcine bancroftii TaxID=1343680 RepID=UPI0038319F18